MANSGVNDWDEGAPIISDPRRQGAGEILSLRKAARGRLNKEHAAFATGDVTTGDGGGEHLPGSALDYYQENAPTLRPDGLTALDTDDAGRKWIKVSTKVERFWSGSGWVPIHTDADQNVISSFDTDLSASYNATPSPVTGLTAGVWLVTLSGLTQHSDGTDWEYTLTLTSGANTVTYKNQSIDTDAAMPFTATVVLTIPVGQTSFSISGVAHIRHFARITGIKLSA